MKRLMNAIHGMTNIVLDLRRVEEALHGVLLLLKQMDPGNDTHRRTVLRLLDVLQKPGENFVGAELERDEHIMQLAHKLRRSKDENIALNKIIEQQRDDAQAGAKQLIASSNLLVHAHALVEDLATVWDISERDELRAYLEGNMPGTVEHSEIYDNIARNYDVLKFGEETTRSSSPAPSQPSTQPAPAQG